MGWAIVWVVGRSEPSPGP